MKLYYFHKQIRLLITYLVLASTLSGCSVIGGIFKAGVQVGIFLVIALIIVILILINRFKKR